MLLLPHGHGSFFAKGSPITRAPMAEYAAYQPEALFPYQMMCRWKQARFWEAGFYAVTPWITRT